MLEKALKKKNKTDTNLISKQSKLHESEHKAGNKAEDVLPPPEKNIYIYLNT